MVRRFFLVTITGFWLVMMTLLIQKEFFGLSPIQTAYDILPLQTASMREGYQAYYLGQERVGFGQTILIRELKEDLEKDKELTPFTLKHTSFLSFLLLGQESDMFVRGLARLDQQLYLKNFSLRISNQDYLSDITGQVKDKKIEVIIEDKESNPVKKVIDLSGPILYSESIIYIWTRDNLRVGKRGKFRVWNPLLLSVEDIHFHVSHKSTIDFNNQPTEVFVILMTKGQITTRLWITPEGEPLQMETPTGIVARKEPGWKIFDAMREEQHSRPDLPNLYSVPANQMLDYPENLKRLKVKITTPESQDYQEILKQEVTPFQSAVLNETIPGNIKQYLKASPFIQSDDPEIKNTAKAIIGNETNAFAATLRLVEWMGQNMTPVPTSSLPSAKQILVTKKGDCNEYTALFTALARSVGIPTRMAAGLVYQNGRFFYHAWPEVYLNEDWLVIDPTFGQVPADVTHLKLVEGNVQDQIAILNTLGNIKISILDYE